MRIILSRKGFDSQYGGVPSPVLPDGRICSLPIPSTFGRASADLRFDGHSIGQMAFDLTGGRIGPKTFVHLDPDLCRATVRRRPGWRPAFGQVSAAQSHLSNQGVGSGDLFLFFGWFRHVRYAAGRWRYLPGAMSFHGLFGWLQVGTVMDLDRADKGRLPAWLSDHPHVEHASALGHQRNTLYVAAHELSFGGVKTQVPGAGVFGRWRSDLQLTAPGRSRSVWRVPVWMEPKAGRPALSYHANPERWIRHGNEMHLSTVAKGQEFVLDAEHYPEAIPWAREVIEQHA